MKRDFEEFQDHSVYFRGQILANNFQFVYISRGVAGEDTREKSSKSGTPGQLCDWACLCWLAGRVGRHRIMLIPPRERETTRSEPESGLRTRDAEKTPRRAASCRERASSETRDRAQTRTWATRCSFASRAVIMVFGIATARTMANQRYPRKVKTRMETCSEI